MPAFEENSFALGPDAGDGDRAAEVATRATRVTQEMRRRKAEAPRMIEARALPATEDEAARQRLERRVSAHLPTGRLALAITDNRYTMISVRRDTVVRGGPLYRVRLHHMFVESPPLVARALARYIALNEPEASRELGRFIDDNQAIIRRAPRRQPPPLAIETRGECFDLQEVFDHLNAAFFAVQIDARITWGPRTSKRRRRTSIKMGSYSVEDRLIRIHPSLDRRFVPRFFLEWIVFHEMLHQVHDIPVVGGRRQFHTAEFLDAERRFPDYDRARLWERQNLDRLLYY